MSEDQQDQQPEDDEPTGPAPDEQTEEEPTSVHASDCAIHNAPAYIPGNCDCGAYSEDELELITLTQETMLGEVRDFFVDYLKNLQEPWEKLNQHAQYDQVHRAESAARHLITQITMIVSGHSREHISAKLVQFTVKDGIKIAVEALNSETNVLALSRMADRRVVIVDADDYDFMGSTSDGNKHVDKDQRELPMADQGDADIDYETQGYSARGEGVEYTDCPYDMNSDEAKEWLVGWRNADEALSEPAQGVMNPIEQAGAEAFESGTEKSDNPYAEGTEEFVWWAKGWQDAEDSDVETAAEPTAPEESDDDGEDPIE